VEGGERRTGMLSRSASRELHGTGSPRGGAAGGATSPRRPPLAQGATSQDMGTSGEIEGAQLRPSGTGRMHNFEAWRREIEAKIEAL
jgi:hypothetical protein